MTIIRMIMGAYALKIAIDLVSAHIRHVKRAHADDSRPARKKPLENRSQLGIP